MKVRRNVRQPDHALVHLLAGFEAEWWAVSREERLAGAQHDWVQVDSILINETEVRQASREVRAGKVDPSNLSLQSADCRLDVVGNKSGVGVADVLGEMTKESGAANAGGDKPSLDLHPVRHGNPD